MSYFVFSVSPFVSCVDVKYTAFQLFDIVPVPGGDDVFSRQAVK